MPQPNKDHLPGSSLPQSLVCRRRYHCSQCAVRPSALIYPYSYRHGTSRRTDVIPSNGLWIVFTGSLVTRSSTLVLKKHRKGLSPDKTERHTARSRKNWCSFFCFLANGGRSRCRAISSRTLCRLLDNGKYLLTDTNAFLRCCWRFIQRLLAKSASVNWRERGLSEDQTWTYSIVF